MLGQPAALALQYFDKILCRSEIRKWGYFTVSTGPTRIGSFLKMFDPSLGKPADIRYRKMLIFRFFEDIILMWQSMANLPFSLQNHEMLLFCWIKTTKTNPQWQVFRAGFPTLTSWKMAWQSPGRDSEETEEVQHLVPVTRRRVFDLWNMDGLCWKRCENIWYMDIYMAQICRNI